MKVTLHHQGWTGSRPRAPDEEPDAALGLLVEIDGLLIDRALNARVISRGNDFAMVTLRLIPGDIETIVHDAESWDELVKRIP